MNTTPHPTKPITTSDTMHHTENSSDKTKALLKKIHLILTIVNKDIRQIYRHGLLLMLVLSIFLLFTGIIFFSMANGQFKKSGVPTWTGDIIISDGTGTPVVISANNMTGYTPFTVSFTSTVTGEKSTYTYLWDFGDGNLSTAKNPTHTYTVPRTYAITLTIHISAEDNITSNVLRIIAVEQGDDRLQVDISSNCTGGTVPLEVSFLSAVVGGNQPYTYTWEFGDGHNSTKTNPNHIYAQTGEYKVKLTIRDSGTNQSVSNTLTIEVSEQGGGLPFTILDVAYGYTVLVTIILIPTAFATSYNHEMKQGSIRTLVCYPIGVFDITIAKLLYSAIVGMIFAVPTLLPLIGLGKPAGDILLIFLTAYTLSMITVAAGALIINTITFFTKRMYIRPTTLPYYILVFSFLFTSKILKWTITAIMFLIGKGGAADSIVQTMSPIIMFSPYHQGGLILSAVLGGPGFPNPLIFLVPVVILAAGIWYSKKLYPDIYEKE